MPYSRILGMLLSSGSHMSGLSVSIDNLHQAGGTAQIAMAHQLDPALAAAVSTAALHQVYACIGAAVAFITRPVGNNNYTSTKCLLNAHDYTS